MPAPNGKSASTLEACIAQCKARAGCVLVDYVPSTKLCYVKSSIGPTKANSGVIGAKIVPKKSTTTTKASTTTTKAPTTTKTVATATTISTVTGSGKRGLCFNKNPMTNFFGGTGSKVTWGYNWAQDLGTGANSKIMYIPMLWSNSADRVQSWSTAAKKAIAAGADTLLGFNEPDVAQQANLAVADAVTAWKANMEPFAGQVKLGAPAVTNGGSPMGLTYLENFISACKGCHVDICPIHWYDSATNVPYFKSYIPQAYKACGNKPIWITEFGASGTDAEITAFLKEVLPWLDSLDYVERYAYFYDGPTDSSGTHLVNAAGTARSAIGDVYNSY